VCDCCPGSIASEESVRITPSLRSKKGYTHYFLLVTRLHVMQYIEVAYLLYYLLIMKNSLLITDRQTLIAAL